MLLLGRGGPQAGGVAELVAGLAGSGAVVEVVACDVADREALGGVLAGRVVSGVVHAAGVLDDGVVSELTSERVVEVLRPKVAGAVNLDELTRGQDLSFFVLFSSVAGLVGGAGQGAYAAANAFLDGLVQVRRAAGLPGQSLAWGLWGRVSGMTGQLTERDLARMTRSGAEAMSDGEGLALFDAALMDERALLVPVKMHRRALQRLADSGELHPLFRGLVRHRRRRAGAARNVRQGGALAERLARLSGADRERAVLDVVREQAAAVLGHGNPSAVGEAQPFKELGFDSLTAVELRNRLQGETGLRLPATLVFDYPTVAALAGFVLAELLGLVDEAVVGAGVAVVGADDPVVIVGMGCRYPGGVRSPEDLWSLVVEGREGIGGFPVDRGWDLEGLYDPDPERVGCSYVREGGFLYGAGEFDAGFFGISPREALAMDPQQRLLLETSWEAFEHAGIDPKSLRGTRTGVYAGLMYHDYAQHLMGVRAEVEGLAGSGNAGSVASGRIAYTLGLEGPAVTVDTACSSSLVALHLAAQALRSGECDVALAGGVAVMATPAVFVEFSRQRALAVDGRCKSFAAEADGTSWAEGVGMLVLERLSDATAKGHQVLAVVRGSAVNQDGASNGLTAPNGPSQQRVIRQALASAGLSTADVDVVEAHGTGTRLGDPIEAQALLATYGQDRPADRSLLLGSIKSNIGHTTAAAGVAGVIKMVQAMRHGIAPKTLHLDEPTPHVDWATGAVELLTDPRPWPELERPRRAGVSSFGISGTNAHVVLEAPTAPEQPAVPEVARPGIVPWVLSAKTADALRGQAERLLSFVESSPDADVADIGTALATTRSVFEHRAVVVADPAGLRAGLGDLTAGRVSGAVVSGVADGVRGPVFVFPGQGAQWVGMGVELMAESSVFAESMAACEVALAAYVDWSLSEVLGDGVALERVDVVQPALWAVMVSLAAVWRACGVEPVAVVGHSQGEIAAAVVAGVLSLEDGARVVALRSQVIAHDLAGRGGMVSVPLGVQTVVELIGRWDGRLSVAAVNGPSSVVVSGETVAVEELLAECQTREVRARRVAVDYASHSVQVETLKDELLRVLEPVRPQAGNLPLYSTVEGGLLETAGMDAEYWYRNLRRTVLFDQAVAAAAEDGRSTVIEVSPHPVLTSAVADRPGEDVVVVGTLRRDQGGLGRFLVSAGEAFVGGVTVDWAAWTAQARAAHTPAARRVELPRYAFQHEWFWADSSSGAGTASPSAADDAVDSAFWEAVERGDAAGLATELDVDGQASLEDLMPAMAAWRRRRSDDATVDSWRYGIRWVPVKQRLGGRLSGTWLVAEPIGTGPGGQHDGAAGPVAALEAAGADTVRIPVPDGVGRAELADTIRAVAAGADDAVQGIVTLPMENTDVFAPTARGEHGAAGGLGARAAVWNLTLLQALGDAGLEKPLWCMTRGAVSTGVGDTVTSPGSATVWGLGQIAALEHPTRWGGLIDLPAVSDAACWHRVAAVLSGPASGAGEDQVAIRRTGVLARRFTHAPAGTPAHSWTPGGTVVITGGTGALGAQVARWAVERGATSLALVSRSGSAASGAAELAEELSESGAQVRILAHDLGERSSVCAMLADAGRDEPVGAVFHTAAVLDDALITSLTPAQVARVLRVKHDSTWYLHEETAGLDLSAFVLFSSLAGTLGASGQGNYAPGNAFLDSFAQYRRAQGLPALSVAWGPWARGGMAEGAIGDIARRHGVPEMEPRLAVLALGRAMDCQDVYSAVADIRWDRYHTAYTATRPSPLLSAIPEVPGPRNADKEHVGDAPALAQGLAGLSRDEQSARILALVREHATAVLGHTAVDAVGAKTAFKNLGFDSVMAVDLRNSLATATGLTLPATLVFDHPSALAVTDHLLGELLGGGTGNDHAPAVPERATATDDPIAIVGMSCRFPGGIETPEDLWRMLMAEGDGIQEFPADRGWDVESLYDADLAPSHTSYVREGGFLDGVGDFDAGFFGINPREALAMDPQQRLLLEASWEALERAGIDADTLKGSRAGVFFGAGGQDYGMLLAQAGADVEGYAGTGNAGSVISGRVAYTLGLEGPAVTVDTACSSSLVAMHLAAQALRSGEASMALAGGVTVMSTPVLFSEFSRQQALSTDGRCKAFAAAADGAGFAEGVGVLVLERLSDARANGHTVLAVVRGSAVNQDGASNGLTAPNGPSQQRVIRQALASAGLSAGDVDAVEAHGTGTRLGDPIEAQALLATYGQGRPAERPLWLGSVKSNIGHTQAAAGVAGVIKMVLAMRHGVLPRTLHVDEPTGEVDWSAGAVELLTEARPWPEVDRPRRSGISSFGISGTNAHVVLEVPEAAEPPQPAPADGSPVEGGTPMPWTVSAKSAAALRSQAARLLAHVTERDELSPRDVGLSLLTTRAQFDQRAVVLGTDREELITGLAELASGRNATTGLATGVVSSGGTGVLFSGQGSQRVGMGRELYGAYPVFADAFDAVCAELDRFLERPLREVVFGDGGLLGRTDFAQAGLFALEVALFELVSWWGVRPDFLLGHSIGEVSAACVAGVLSVEDAAVLVGARGRLMQALPVGGAMVSVEASEEEVLARLVEGVSIAAVNGPMATVISGDEVAVLEIAACFEGEGRRTKRLRVSHAFHSPRMEGMLDDFRGVVEGLTFRVPRIPVVSNVTGGVVSAGELGDPGYWVRHVRESVRFLDGVRALEAEGVGVFLELGPDGVLSALAQECVTGGSEGFGFVPVLRKDRGEAVALVAALAELHVRGRTVDWSGYFSGSGGRRVELPTYAFERERFWPEHGVLEVRGVLGGSGVGDVVWGERLVGLSPAECERELLEVVRGVVAGVLGHRGVEAVGVDRPLSDLGFDSLTAVELRNRLGGVTGLSLPSTLVFDYPSVMALVGFLRGELTGRGGLVGVPLVAAVDAGDPVVIVGMGCRFPGGVRSPEDLWGLLVAGGDGVSGFPVDRGWDVESFYDPEPGRVGKSYVREGGFLEGVGEFDPGFFGISPREALAMDPQQRLLLETSWEALERAGIDPLALRGSRTGVFVGSSGQDYPALLSRTQVDVEGYAVTGSSASVASGRIAYVLGLEGPAVTVDTACSSSLVALHMAAQALRAGECDAALVGGVTVMTTPVGFVEFSRQQGLAPDGRCKSFAAAADGTGWGEGVGVLVVERLSDAEANGHTVLAVVRGSAVNQDGASNGLTAPNGPSQQRVIRQALASAGLSPADIDAVEAHGTGTRLGDPIEAQALLATYGQDRPESRPVWLGSVKSNIGHTQAAAGVAGVVKMVLAMRHGVLPRTLHVDEPSSQVDWSAGAVELLTEQLVWPQTGRPRRAGVSAFGMSGTNAHVVLEQAPEARPVTDERIAAGPPMAGAVVPWVLSGRGPDAVARQATRLVEWLGTRSGVSASEVAAGLLARSRFEHRAVVWGAERAELVGALSKLASGDVLGAEDAGVVSGTVTAGRLVWVFPGQGGQWAGMGVELMAESSVFAESMAACEVALAPYVDWSLIDVLTRDDFGDWSARVDVVQPVLWAVMVSLAAVWRSYGVVPDAVVGHSQGEIAAACVAGVLTLRDAAKVVALRSRAIAEELSGLGGMVSVAASAEEVGRILDGAGVEGVGIAAVNGPRAVVVSGSMEGLAALAQVWERHGIRAREVAVDYASHGAGVEVLRERLSAELADITPVGGELALCSTVTGEWCPGVDMDAAYWVDNLRRPVRLAEVMGLLGGQGYTRFIEISPHPVLTLGIQDTLEDAGVGGFVSGTLRRDMDERAQLRAALARAYVNGVEMDWSPYAGGPALELPTYPFASERYWPQAPTSVAPTGEVAASSWERRFWDAVEREDLESLSGVLEVAPGEGLGEVLPALSSWRRRSGELSKAGSWRYVVSWQPVRTVEHGAPQGTWLVVSERGQGELPLVDALRAQGCGLLQMEVDGVDRESLAEALTEATTRESEDPQLAGVISLLGWGLEGQAPSLAVLALVQALGDAGVPAPLWWVTRGAVSVGRSGGVVDPAQTAVWGLGRVAALELPSRWGGLVDIPEVLDERAAARVCAVLAGGEGEDQIAVRGSGVFVRRLVPAPASGSEGEGWSPRGTVLVTGGTGALGGHVARWAAGKGAERLVLTSRRGLEAPGAVKLVAELEALGAAVEVAACEVSDRKALAELVRRVEAGGGPVRAVVHTAGVGQATPLGGIDAAEFAEVVRAKAGGAVCLDEMFADRDLDAFVLFTSGAGVWGSGGQGAYAAANAWADGVALARRARGVRAVAVSWGAWGGGGMVEASEGDEAALLRRGMPVMDPSLALLGLEQILAADDAHAVVADVEWERFAPAFTSLRSSRLLEGVPQAQRVLEEARASVVVSTRGAALRERLAGLSAADREREVVELIGSEAAVVLRHSGAETVTPERPLSELGLDSLTAVELRNRLQERTGLSLPSTLLFDYPTPRALAKHLVGEFREELPEDTTDAAGVTPATAQAPVESSGSSVLAELGRLETALASAQLEDMAYSGIEDRLRALLATIGERTGPASDNSAAADLESAGVDDVFDYIDKKFGKR
nr:SDR family NAD(P)-dependent oxidoreductase [Streptomyces canus]